MRRSQCTSAMQMSLLLAITGLALGACGGRQSIGVLEVCSEPTEDMRTDRLEAEIACYVTKPLEETGAWCRRALDFWPNYSPDALRTAAECALATNERADGARIAEILDAVAEDPVRVAAVADAMGARFDTTVHANTFGVALTTRAQEALGQQIETMPEAARQAVVEVGLAYTLEPLATYARPYLRDLPPDSPAVAAYAAGVVAQPSSGEISEDDRWALIAGGEWDAVDIVSCARGELRGCENVEGESPVMLLDLTPVEMEDNPAPNNTIIMIRTGELSDEEITAATAWLGRTEYSIRADIVRRLMIEMTNTDLPATTRQAIARGATGAMCDGAVAWDFLARSSTTPHMSPDPTPWDLYLTSCYETWDASELLLMLGAGWRLSATEGVVDTMLERLTELVADTSCDDLEAMASDVYGERGRFKSMGSGFVMAAWASGDRCVEQLEGPIDALYRQREEHPHARLLAGEWFLSQGDDRVCGSIDSILDWTDPDYESGPGDEAEALAEELRGACD